MSLKDLLSLDVTPKLKTIDKYSNKNFISKIEKREGSFDDYETIMLVLNMTFGEWLSLFTYKKSINEILNEKGEGKNEKINTEKIENAIDEVNEQLKNIILKFDDEDFSLFVFYLYNYEQSFNIKAGRNKKSSK